jgi:hypothetical protein
LIVRSSGQFRADNGGARHFASSRRMFFQMIGKVARSERSFRGISGTGTI